MKKANVPDNLTKSKRASTREPPALYRLSEAARLLGISKPTLKLWIRRGNVRSVPTPGGHHRIPYSEVERLAGSVRAAVRAAGGELEAISGRNKLRGVVRAIKYDGLLAQVTMAVGDQALTAIITRDAAQALGLQVGTPAYGLIKATEVMVIRA